MAEPQNKPIESKPQVEIRAVSMYPVQWSIVDVHAKESTDDNTSAALRRIVTEWSQFKALQQALPFQYSPPTPTGDSGRP